jgi:hypothetical protein
MKFFLFILLIFIVKIESYYLSCKSRYCLNNSTCIDNGYNKTKCECNLAYNGTRCQYCLCFSNNKTCSISGDIICNTLDSSYDFWKYNLFLFLFLLVFFSLCFCCFCCSICCICGKYFVEFCAICCFCGKYFVEFLEFLFEYLNVTFEIIRDIFKSIWCSNQRVSPTPTNQIQNNSINIFILNNNNNNESPKCIICFESLKNERAKTISCGHTFHENCIDNWFNVNPTNPSCPLRCKL